MKMKNAKLKATYDKEPDAGYIYLGKIAKGEAAIQVVVEDERINGMIVLDLDVNERLLGIELIGIEGMVKKPLPWK